MPLVPGYQISAQIYEGIRTLVYRGQKTGEADSVILKVIKNPYPTPQDIARVRHEYEIIKNLKLRGVVKAIALEKTERGLALIIEDFGGQSLTHFLASNKLDLTTFLNIAIAIVESLKQLHENQIIHKDIKPQNIIINPTTGQVKITDFSIASRLSTENQNPTNPNSIEGSLAYMSPEQTGRMNRSLDYRTDFYSLGVTFYEILTGKLPFTTTDPIELVHSQIAISPVPPSEIVPDIPGAISKIILKLLAKAAEARYQSAEGLKFDLETCLIQLQNSGRIEDMLIGRRDRGAQLLIPQKLYGREAEVSQILATFERVSGGSLEAKTAKSRSEMMLVSGYSGIGKTAVVNEVHKPIVRQRGYFISGKFDQFQRNIPYSAIVNAFQSLIRQLLSETNENVEVWKGKLLTAFGDNGQVIIDVIPEVELIVGKQPELPKLGATESQNRFNRVFQKFVEVFCQKEHPLVIFVDDLQWADSASLKLINLLMTDAESQYLMLIGAYRDHEVSPTHPLIQTLEEIQNQGAIANHITLQPLALDSVVELIADSLKESDEPTTTQKSVKSLAELLYNKTQGNPFFLTQLLKTFYQEKLLFFEISNNKWQWNIEEIQAVGITDFNVVELMARNLRKLSPNTQKVLKLAACIGNQFNLDVLAVVNEESTTITATQLWEALQAGLILPLNEDYKIPLVFRPEEMRLFNFDETQIVYKFLHDRVQQAAYSLILEQEKQQTHLKIGRLLLQNISPEEREENIFALVNQLNFGIDLIARKSEREELASLNLIAGKKAKSAIAYSPAVRYLNLGLELLETDSWQGQYDLTLALYFEAAEAEYFNANLEEAKTLADLGIKEAKTTLDAVKFYDLTIKLYIAQSELQKSLDIGIEILKRLEVKLEKEAPKDLDVNDLLNLPAMSDPYKIAALQILLTIQAPAAIANNPLALPIIFTMVKLCSEYGNSKIAAFTYGIYAVFMQSLSYEIDVYEFFQVSIKLIDKFNAKEFKCKLYTILGCNILHWRDHAKKTLAPLRDSIQIALEVGDLEYACHGALFYSEHLFLVGEDLESVGKRQEEYINTIAKLEQEYQLQMTKIRCQTVLNLLERAEDKKRLIGETFNEAEMLPLFLEANNVLALFSFYAYKSFLSYLFKDYPQSIENSKLAEEHKIFAKALLLFSEYNFYYSLALLANYSQVEPAEQQQYLKTVAENQEQMKDWAHQAPMNFQHKYDLVEAEKARILGETLAAMELYDRAINGAKENGYIQHQAIANERAAEFYLTLDRETIARSYILDSYYCYVNWGAKAKVTQLEAEYPQFLNQIYAPSFTESDQNISLTTHTTTGNSAFLDLTTIVKASQAIASEIILDKLLEKLIKILVENAGAEIGFLLLKNNENLFIAAETSIGSPSVKTNQSIPVDAARNLPKTLINYVRRTRADVVLNNAAEEGQFTADPYFAAAKIKSVLCTPIINQNQLVGILYLENNIISQAFTQNRLEILKILSAQAAISLENALLYNNLETANQKLEDYNQTLEGRVAERTAELTASEAKLQEAQKLAHLGNWEWDLVTNQLYWSDEIYRIFGFEKEPPETLFQKHVAQIHPEDFEIWQTGLNLLQSEGKPYHFDFRIISSDGSVKYLSAKGEAAKDADGKVIKLFGTAQDISDRKLVEEALRESESELREKATQLEQTLRDLQTTQSQLIHSEKMSSLGQMVAGVAHEINNPINFIYGNVRPASEYVTDLLDLLRTYQHSYPTPTPEVEEKIEELDIEFVVEDVQSLLTSMHNGAERIRNIVASLRNFSRLDESEIKAVDIHEGIESTLLILQHRLRPFQETNEETKTEILVIKNYGSLPQVICYPNQINQVFLNLFNNAIDAFDKVNTNDQKLDFSPTITISTSITEDGLIQIKIADNGSGIPENIVKKIFDPFFTTKPVGSGTGLGLYVSYQIVVERHRGQLTCNSIAGVGTEFVIKIGRVY